jgi:SAM-dependent methyltransferase
MNQIKSRYMTIVSVLLEVRFRPLFSGILSFIPGVFGFWDRIRPMGNTVSAKYCQSIWQIHRDKSQHVNGGAMPVAVAELGPGASLGVCIAALLDGVDTAVALDAGHYEDRAANLRILQELGSVGDTSTSNTNLISAVERAGGPHEERLRYVAPWSDPNVLAANSLDLIFSHSVLEHVDEPLSTYTACFRWLGSGGVMSHKIDHSSHGITRRWNGHYALPEKLWALIYGRRPYLLNRQRPRQHLADMASVGFEILPESSFVVEENNVQRTVTLANLPADDHLVRTSMIITRKPQS